MGPDRRPRMVVTVGKQFYMRLSWTYLLGIYCASTNMCACMWSELVAHHGANDVVSSLSHFVFNTQLGHSGAKWSIWCADNGKLKTIVSSGFFRFNPKACLF